MPGRSYLEQLTVPAGTVICREGESGQMAYLIERGEIEISIVRQGDSVVIARRSAGEIFGEMAIIGDAPRTATVTATTDCALLGITREQIHRRLEQADPILRMCLGVVLERFRSTLRRLQAIDAELDEPISDLATVHQSIDTPSYEDVIREIKLEKELEAALDREDFVLHYQPIIDLQAGTIAGFEALVRWRHSEQGLIAPNRFIPTAEASGLIVPLDRWCFNAACAALRRLDDLFDENQPPFMSVNISGGDFADPSFVGNVERVLDETGVDPHRVKLEITESLLMRHPERAAEALDACKVKGLSITVDDFGTGYSSLSYLHRFPVDTLKIDRSFVASMHGSPQSMEIVRTIVVLARQLGIPVVAEGVETLNDATILRNLGYQYGQGYYFARPMPEDAIAKLIQDWSGSVHIRELA